MRESRVAACSAVALHVGVLAALLAYEPMRSAVVASAPMMVEWIVPPRVEPPRPEMEPQKPKLKPKPVARPRPQRAEPPRQIVAAVPEAPTEVAPPPVVEVTPPAVAEDPLPEKPVSEGAPTARSAVVSAPPPSPLTPPIFNAGYLENPPPPYPPASRKLGEQGRVILRVRVTAEGRAGEVQVRTSSGYARLDDSARETVARWKFLPAKRGEEPVAAWVLIPISFNVER